MSDETTENRTHHENESADGDASSGEGSAGHGHAQEADGQDSSERDSSDRDLGSGFKAGIRQGLDVLSALKDAIEETINDAKARGDISQDRAKKVMRDAMHKAQEAAGAAREKVEFINRQELQKFMDSIDERLRRLEEKLGFSSPDVSDDSPEDAARGQSEED